MTQPLPTTSHGSIADDIQNANLACASLRTGEVSTACFDFDGPSLRRIYFCAILSENT